MICPNCRQEIEPVEETNSTVTVIKDKVGKILIWTEETKDTDGILVSKRVDEYTYFDKTGDINIIIQKVYDGEGTVRYGKTVQHFEDGTQPVTTELINSQIVEMEK